MANPAEIEKASQNGSRSMPLVQGRCPSCGKNTLFLGSGGYVTCSLDKCSDPEAPTKLLEGTLKLNPPDDHMEVLLRAHAIYLDREVEYSDIWKEYGLKGVMVHLRTCVTRSWKQVWSGRIGKTDNLLDAINYAAFAVRNMDASNIEGTWGYE